MTTITIDDDLIHEIITVSHYQNAQEAVIKILSDYLQKQQIEPPFFDQLRLVDDVADDDLALLFERDKDTGRDTAL